MKVLLIGASGTIGSAVARALASAHEMMTASRSGGQLKVDIADPASIEAMFRQAGSFDALVSAAGSARFGPLAELKDEDFLFSLQNKLMGQVNLVRIGQRYINDNGSFTLTSGVLASKPMPGSSAISLVNAGVEGFARAAQLELGRGLRINVVSPVWVSETLQKLGRDPAAGLSAEKTAKAYLASVDGTMQGQVLDVTDYA